MVANLQRQDLLPGEVGVVAAEVTVGSGLLVTLVATALEVEVDGHHTGAEVEGGLHLLQDLRVTDLASAVGVHEHGQGVGNTDSVGHLHDRAAGEASSDDGLGGLAHDVRAGAVDLGGVLAGEGTATVGAPATVGVDDDLAASEAGVTVGATDHEAAGGVEVEDGLVVKVLGGHNLLHNLVHQVLSDLLVGDGLVVLGGDQDGVHAEGHHGATLVLVLAGHLGLAVGAHPGAGAVLADLGQPVADLGGEHVGEGHQLLGLISSVAEHVTLVTGADLLGLLGAHAVHALANIGRLLLNVHQNLAGVAVKTNILVNEADLLSGLAHNSLVVDLGLGGDLTEDHDHTGLGGGLASHLGVGVLLEARIENGVGHLIRQLIGVTLVDGLGGEQESLNTLRHGCYVWK
mmetsp:Transcript_11503/g.24032  ORF Transcript_11503/g.24032 Transcript_11503/m.24032 type:complete len:402 (+) Transcript_11503:179-1384(+)